MGGTDMERHRRGWKETRLSKQRLVEFIAKAKRLSLSLSLSLFPFDLGPSLAIHFSLSSFFPLVPLRLEHSGAVLALLLAPCTPPWMYLDIKAR